MIFCKLIVVFGMLARIAGIYTGNGLFGIKGDKQFGIEDDGQSYSFHATLVPEADVTFMEDSPPNVNVTSFYAMTGSKNDSTQLLVSPGENVIFVCEVDDVMADMEGDGWSCGNALDCRSEGTLHMADMELMSPSVLDIKKDNSTDGISRKFNFYINSLSCLHLGCYGCAVKHSLEDPKQLIGLLVSCKPRVLDNPPAELTLTEDGDVILTLTVMAYPGITSVQILSRNILIPQDSVINDVSNKEEEVPCDMISTLSVSLKMDVLLNAREVVVRVSNLVGDLDYTLPELTTTTSPTSLTTEAATTNLTSTTTTGHTTTEDTTTEDTTTEDTNTEDTTTEDTTIEDTTIEDTAIEDTTTEDTTIEDTTIEDTTTSETTSTEDTTMKTSTGDKCVYLYLIFQYF
ncbi:hypothetical protein Btru_039964 [Bulinus truncatus]|nr:hypothetical protein Btru_039964 [Bulinus truncatus]